MKYCLNSAILLNVYAYDICVPLSRYCGIASYINNCSHLPSHINMHAHTHVCLHACMCHHACGHVRCIFNTNKICCSLVAALH